MTGNSGGQYDFMPYSRSLVPATLPSCSSLDTGELGCDVYDLGEPPERLHVKVHATLPPSPSASLGRWAIYTFVPLEVPWLPSR